MDNELVKIEVGFTLSAVRVIKAYASLTGKTAEDIAVELSEGVSEIVEASLKKKIAGELGIEAVKTQVAPVKVSVQNTANTYTQRGVYTDTTGISDGLGDADLEEPSTIEGDTSPDAFVPAYGGLTDETIEKDMQVEDENVEAAAEPVPTWADQLAQGDGGEKMFAEAAGIVDDRIAKRRHKRNTGKGKVTSLSADSMEE